MSFQIGQRYQSPSHARRTAAVVHIGNAGSKAFVEIRADDGSMVNSGWVDFEQFGNHWRQTAEEAARSAA
jgi:hypothetical protein